MGRPKKDTPEGKAAAEKWRRTMEGRYGSVTEKMREVGRIGELNGRGPYFKGGFAGNRELAVRAGRKGGKISKRRSPHQRILEENRDLIIDAKEERRLKALAQELGIPYHCVTHYSEKNGK